MALNVGERLGSFEVLSSLGAGGMGEVYRARDTRLGREVAVKVLPEEFSRDAERLARFDREARVLASLSHPGIAALYGLEESGSVRYLVMELVAGETIAERLSRGPLSLAEATQVFRQVAEALEGAHAKGVIHRDLKPANIKVAPDGRVKCWISAWRRCSSAIHRVGSGKSPTITKVATRAGVVLGTPAYMSPEQARGQALDRRTDVWSFGCLLYEALTGRRAFSGHTTSDTLVAVLGEEPDWGALPAATPATVRSLLQRCLRKDAEHRLRDIADARLELEEAQASTAGGSAGASAPEASRRRLIVAAAAFTLLAIAGS
jgi:serine/threonine protein kinase